MNPDPAALPVYCHGITKAFRRGMRARTPALNGIDFTLGAGEICALLGPNGAGKSTLFKILAGLTPADRGQALVWGQPAGSFAARSRIGYVGENDELHPGETVHATLNWFARLRGWPFQEARNQVEKVVLQLGLEHCLQRTVGTCSKGTRRRISLAVALLAEPDLLLLDEPSAGLDPEAHVRLIRLLEALRAGGTSILLSTHGLTPIENVCDSVAILFRGRIVRAGKLSTFRGETSLAPVFSGENWTERDREELKTWIKQRGLPGDWHLPTGVLESMYRETLQDFAS